MEACFQKSSIKEEFYLLSRILKYSLMIDHLGTVVGKYINGYTLKNMGLVETVDQLETDLTESMIVSDLMADFPPILKEDNPEVLVAYVTTHYEQTGEIINLSSIPETMASTPFRIASKKRKSKKSTSEAIDEPKRKKQKQSKKAPKLNVVVESTLPTIQEEDVELEPAKILSKRTRGGTSSGSSEVVPAPFKIPKKKRYVRKMKVSNYVLQEDAEVEASSDLVSRVERRKKANADQEAFVVEKALTAANQIEIPASTLVRETATRDAKKVVKFVEDVKKLDSSEVGELLKATMEVNREGTGCSKAGTSETTSSEATRGNTSHIISDDIIDLEFTSPSNSSDTKDYIPFNRIYSTLDKSLALSPSTKHWKKPADDEFVPLYPTVLERIGDMAQMRLDICQKLPTDHFFQPQFIQPLQTIRAE